MNISVKQNNELNINRLAAQRQIYTDAKKLTYFQFLLCGIIIVICSLFRIVINEEYDIYIIILSIICIIFNEIFLTDKIKNLKYKAAMIQEEFDCDVLQINKNIIKYGNISMLEIIKEYSIKYLIKNKNYEKLKNWYSDINIENKYIKLFCQNMNIWWNQKLRERYTIFLLSSISVIFLVLLIFAVIYGLTIKTFISYVFFPVLPSLVLVYRTNKDNKESIRKLKDLKIKYNNILEKTKDESNYINNQYESDVRNLQDLIFDNRAYSPLIPDILYFLSRNKYEKIAYETTKEQVSLLISESEKE